MTLDEMCGDFEGLLCRYGGGLRNWPEDIRPVLLRYLRQSYDARRRVVEMRRMEDMLRDDPPDLTLPDGLEDRIIGAMLKLKAQG